MEEKNNQVGQAQTQVDQGQVQTGGEMSNFGAEETGKMEGSSTAWWKNKTFIGVVVAGVLLAVAGVFYFTTNMKQQKSYVNRMEKDNTVVSPTSTPEATGGAAAVPTVSDDTSLETIEKEIESLQVEGLDQGDPSIESELQNL